MNWPPSILQAAGMRPNVCICNIGSHTYAATSVAPKTPQRASQSSRQKRDDSNELSSSRWHCAAAPIILRLKAYDAFVFRQRTNVRNESANCSKNMKWYAPHASPTPWQATHNPHRRPRRLISKRRRRRTSASSKRLHLSHDASSYFFRSHAVAILAVIGIYAYCSGPLSSLWWFWCLHTNTTTSPPHCVSHTCPRYFLCMLLVMMPTYGEDSFYGESGKPRRKPHVGKRFR